MAHLAGRCSWEKDGAPVGLEADKYEWAEPKGGAGGGVGGVAGDCSLVVRAASPEYDDGWWVCQVSASSPQQGDAVISAPALLTVAAPPEEVVILHTAEDGGRGPVCVTAAANPPAQLRVTIDGAPVSVAAEQRDTRLASGGWRSVLELAGLATRPRHGRTLGCEARHPATRTTLAAATTLNITFAPEIVAVSAVLGPDGETAALRCAVESNPAAEIVWRHADTGRQLRGATATSAGEYECVAESRLGRAVSAPVTVRLRQPPLITSTRVTRRRGDTVTRRNVTRGDTSAVVTVEAGDSLELLCAAVSVPGARFRWLQRTSAGEITVAATRAAVSLASADYGGAGDYLCEATNRFGTSLGELVGVAVEGKPEIRNAGAQNFTVVSGEEFEFELEVCAHPPAEVTWWRGAEQLGGGAGAEQLQPPCLVSRLRLPRLAPRHGGQYRAVATNSRGRASLELGLRVLEAAPPSSPALAAGAGAVLVLALLAAAATWRRRIMRRKSTPTSSSSSTSTSSSTASSSTSTSSSTVSMSNPPSEPGPEVVDVNTAIRTPKEVPAPAPAPAPPRLYTQLSLPTASNCGSMRRKRAEHCSSLLEVYREAVTRNLAHSGDPQSRLYV